MLDEHGKYFLDLLADLREGRAANEAGAALAAVTEGVHDTAGPGSVTLTLRLALRKDSADIVETVDAVTKKTPEERKDAWFFGPGGSLQRRKPRSNEPGLFDEPEPSDEEFEPSADDEQPD